MLDLKVIVARDYVPGRPKVDARTMLASLIHPLFFFVAAQRSVQMVPVKGTEIEIEAPLRLSERFHRRTLAASQERLKDLLAKVPAYAALLKEYHDAIVLPAKK